MRHPAPPASAAGSLSTPRAAALAGIVFAVLLAAAIALVRIALPDAASGADVTIAPGRRGALATALELVPFAGIAFLWFMGALRENAGDAEDRFITTVFMGSGLIFVGTLFASVAATGTVLDNDQGSQFGRHFAYTLLTTYAMRMAAVFVFATSTIGRKLGVLPLPVALFGYAVGLVLLVAGSSFPWSEMIFPAWALIVSLCILSGRSGASGASG